MGKTIELNNRIVGEGNPCYIIAELGSNHNRELEMAKRGQNMVDGKGTERIISEIPRSVLS